MTQELRARVIGEGVPVVWIHGFPLSSRIFDPITAISGVKHLLIELPGFGGTVHDPEIRSIANYAESVLSTMDALQIERASIAGVSMGGYVALALARLAPHRVMSLMLVDTRETADSEEARKTRFDQATRVRTEGPNFLIEQMLPKMLTKRTSEERPQTLELVRRSMESATPDGIIAALGAMGDRPGSEDVLRNVDVPVLIVVGAEDGITPPADAQRMAALAARSTLVTLPEAAHLSHLDQPALFQKAVGEFLDRQTGRDAAAGIGVRNLALTFALTGALLLGGCQEEDLHSNVQVQTIENTSVPQAKIEPPPEIDTTETERKFSQTERIALAREGKMKDGQLLVETAPRVSLPFTPAIAMDPVDGSKLSITTLTPTFEYKGKIYYFSSTGNRSAFTADPEKFVKGALSKY